MNKVYENAEKAIFDVMDIVDNQGTYKLSKPNEFALVFKGERF